jgi:hypothetical protein
MVATYHNIENLSIINGALLLPTKSSNRKIPYTVISDKQNSGREYKINTILNIQFLVVLLKEKPNLI